MKRKSISESADFNHRKVNVFSLHTFFFITSFAIIAVSCTRQNKSNMPIKKLQSLTQTTLLVIAVVEQKKEHTTNKCMSKVLHKLRTQYKTKKSQIAHVSLQAVVG